MSSVSRHRPIVKAIAPLIPEKWVKRVYAVQNSVIIDMHKNSQAKDWDGPVLPLWADFNGRTAQDAMNEYYAGLIEVATLRLSEGCYALVGIQREKVAPRRYPLHGSDGVDTSDVPEYHKEDQAKKLAQRIGAYWEQQGFTVKTWVVQIKDGGWAVKSDLVNGLPS